MKRVLFVDDEEAVLEGLRVALRRQRTRWEMVFVTSGEAALAAIEAQPFDVVVSDMRMPGMDGAQLLERVRSISPAAARLVLSGHADQDVVLRALPHVNQFLEKPCDPDVLKLTIERACDLQSLVGSDAVRAVVGKVEALPSPPDSYWRLIRALEDEDSALDTVSRIVEEDSAMSIQVLHLASSAFFGHGMHGQSIRQAVAYLGMELMRALVISAQVFPRLERLETGELTFAAFQTHALDTGILCRELLRGGGAGDDGFTAGLLHAVGKIVIATSRPAGYANMIARARERRLPLHVVETEMLGVTHAEVGAYLLGAWGLPMTLVENVAYHHRPGALGERSSEVLRALHVADALVRARAESGTSALEIERLDADFLKQADVDGSLPRWREIAADLFPPSAEAA